MDKNNLKQRIAGTIIRIGDGEACANTLQEDVKQYLISHEYIKHIDPNEMDLILDNPEGRFILSNKGIALYTTIINSLI